MQKRNDVSTLKGVFADGEPGMSQAGGQLCASGPISEGSRHGALDRPRTRTLLGRVDDGGRSRSGEGSASQAGDLPPEFPTAEWGWFAAASDTLNTAWHTLQGCRTSPLSTPRQGRFHV